MWVAPKIMSRPGEAKQVKARLDIQNLETALKLYKLDNGSYPSTEQGLQALVELPETGLVPKKWKKGGYLEKGRVPKDPWRNDFIYLSPGLKGDFDIICYGGDGVPGGEDENKDINNWEIE
jgi:general secretion pathway protein G